MFMSRTSTIQPVLEPPPLRKQARADSKRNSKMTKINFPVAHKVFNFTNPRSHPQVLLPFTLGRTAVVQMTDLLL
jgi:hypothetical protein